MPAIATNHGTGMRAALRSRMRSTLRRFASSNAEWAQTAGMYARGFLSETAGAAPPLSMISGGRSSPPVSAALH